MTPVFLILPRNEPLFARQCALNSFSRGESPFAPMLAYGVVLDLRSEHEVAMAERASTAWLEKSERVVCYIDHKISRSMLNDLERAKRRKLTIEFRRLAGGRPGLEVLHQQGVPHDEEGCALCTGPRQWEEMKREK